MPDEYRYVEKVAARLGISVEEAGAILIETVVRLHVLSSIATEFVDQTPRSSAQDSPLEVVSRPRTTYRQAKTWRTLLPAIASLMGLLLALAYILWKTNG